MTAYLIWAIVGFLLIIVELLTGTFYLLVFGVAALIGALVAWLGGPFWLQVVATAAAALLGTYLVHRWWRSHPKDSAAQNSLEVGQTVVFENWVNEANHTARVKYRGASWDARVNGTAKPDDVLTITATEQGVLVVSN